MFVTHIGKKNQCCRRRSTWVARLYHQRNQSIHV